MAYLVSKRRGFDTDLVSELDSWMNNVFGTAYAGGSGFPAVDIRTVEDGYVLEAEIPGLSKDDVSVRVEDKLLVIESTQREEKETNGDEPARYLRRERRVREFRRSFALPKDVDGSKIEAAYRDGMLILTLPKRPEAKPRTIKIESA